MLSSRTEQPNINANPTAPTEHALRSHARALAVCALPEQEAIERLQNGAGGNGALSADAAKSIYDHAESGYAGSLLK